MARAHLALVALVHDRLVKQRRSKMGARAESEPRQKKLIFRRYRKVLETGEILDARKYGFKAWPIWVDVEAFD